MAAGRLAPVVCLSLYSLSFLILLSPQLLCPFLTLMWLLVSSPSRRLLLKTSTWLLQIRKTDRFCSLGLIRTRSRDSIWVCLFIRLLFYLPPQFSEAKWVCKWCLVSCQCNWWRRKIGTGFDGDWSPASRLSALSKAALSCESCYITTHSTRRRLLQISSRKRVRFWARLQCQVGFFVQHMLLSSSR